jgi:anti-sigma B factor antagonist
MAESQYVGIQRIGSVAVAQVLREKITEHENQPVFTELTNAAAAANHRLAVDLSGVGLLSSAGLGGMITLHKACAAGGGKLVVFGLQDQILDVLKLTHLNKLLTIADSRDAALKKAAS